MTKERVDSDGVIHEVHISKTGGNALGVKRHNLDGSGRELLDSRPIAPPVGFKRVPSLSEQIRDMVRSERLAQEVAAQGMETFEEADDFEVGDDFDPSSPYEEQFDPTPISELRERQAAALEAQRLKAGKPPAAPGAPDDAETVDSP